VRWGLIAICALLLAWAGAALWLLRPDDDAGGGNPRRSKPVIVISAGNPSPVLVLDVVHHLRGLGLHVKIGSRVPLPQEAFNRRRGQYELFRFNRAIGRLDPYWAPKKQLVLVITDADLFHFKEPDSRFSFTGRHLDGIAVVPTARIDETFYGRPKSRTLLRHRALKLVDLNVGVLVYGLPRSRDPRSVMYHDIDSLDDIDRMRHGFDRQESAAQARWRRAADKLCGLRRGEVLASIVGFRRSNRPTRDRVLELGGKTVAIRLSALAELRSLPPPSQDTATVREFLAALERAVDFDRALMRRLRRSWDTAKLHAGLARSITLGAHARSYALDLGADSCADLLAS
jgi:predicted Zn-dependent protease